MSTETIMHPSSAPCYVCGTARGRDKQVVRIDLQDGETNPFTLTLCAKHRD